jgi:hypothetical protein
MGRRLSSRRSTNAQSQPLDDGRYANVLDALCISRAVECERNDSWILSVAMVETALENLP